VEWDGDEPVAVVELTMRDPADDPMHRSSPPPAYFASVLQRYDHLHGTKEGYFCKIAKRIGCHGYIVVYNEVADQFWVYRRTEPWQDGWRSFDLVGYENFLCSLKGSNGN
jgi:hypothetical protein